MILTAVSTEQTDDWLHELRIRVASAEFLHQRAQSGLASTVSVQEVKEKVENFLLRDDTTLVCHLVNVEATSPSKVVKDISQLQKGIQNLDLVNKGTAQGAKIAAQ